MKKKITIVLLLLIHSCIYAQQPYSSSNSKNKNEQYYITLSTAKAIGEEIKFRIFSEDNDVWIDLNNNGVKDTGEDDIDTNGSERNYTLGAKTIVLYGKIRNLYCYHNQLSELDVSKNTQLTILWCGENQLTELDVSKNTQLTYLSCYHNQLTELDVSKNTQLTILSCYDNQLSELDVSKNTQLTSLVCDDNQLSELDVSKNTQLTRLYCAHNQLTALNVANGNNTNWSSGEGWLYAFNATNNPNLNFIQIDEGFTPSSEWHKDDHAQYSTNCSGETTNNSYIEITTEKEIGENITLTIEAASSEQNTIWIDLNNNSEQDANETITKFGEIGVPYKLRAKTIRIYGNVTGLNCHSNKIVNISIKNNPFIQDLNCGNNQLSKLDVSTNTKLQKITCAKNKLTNLNVSNNLDLEALSCFSNEIQNLDLTNNQKLINLQCSHNQLKNLDVSNNSKLSFFDCRSNPQLFCIKVNTKQASSIPINWRKDYDAKYNINCGESESYKPTIPSNPFPNSGDININKNITLSWESKSNLTDGKLGYDLYIGEKNKERKLYTGKGKKQNIYNLKSNTLYEWRVIVYDSKGQSTKSPLWTFTTGEMSAPTEPSNPYPANGVSDVMPTVLKWSSELDGGNVGFDLYIGKKGKNRQHYTGKGTNCSISKLENNCTYEWRVISYSNNGTKTTGPLWTFTTGSSCGKLDNTTFTRSNVTTNSFIISWDKISNADNYEIIICKASDADYSKIVASAKTAHNKLQVIGLKPNTEYKYIIRSHCNNGWGEWVASLSTVRTLNGTVESPSKISVSKMYARQIGKNMQFKFNISTPSNKLENIAIEVDKKGNNYNNSVLFCIEKPYESGYHNHECVFYNHPSLNKTGIYEFRVIAKDNKGNSTSTSISGKNGENNNIFFYEKASEGVGANNAEIGNIVMNLSHNYDIVTIEFDAVSKVSYYNIYRNGVKIETIRNNNLTGKRTITDIVSKKGKYTYRIIPGNYLYEEAEVYAEKTITITDISKVTKGNIYGVIKDKDGNKISRVKVRFSNDNSITYSANGVFKSPELTYGTKGTISFEKEGYVFSPVSFSIDKPSTQINIIAHKKNNSNTNNYDNVNAGEYEIEITKPMVLTNNGLEIKTGDDHFTHVLVGDYYSSYKIELNIKNISTDSWKGVIVVELEKNGKIEMLGKSTLMSLDPEKESEINIPIVFNDIEGHSILRIMSRKQKNNHNYITNTFDSKRHVASSENKTSYNLKYVNVENEKFDVDEATKDVEKRLNIFAKGFGYLNTTTKISQGFYPDNKYLSTLDYMTDEIKNGLKLTTTPIKYYNKCIEIIDAIDDITNEQDDFIRYWKVMQILSDYTISGHPAGMIITQYMKVPLKAKDAIDRILSGTEYDKLKYNENSFSLRIGMQKEGNTWFSNLHPSYFNIKEDVIPYIKEVTLNFEKLSSNQTLHYTLYKETVTEDNDFVVYKLHDYVPFDILNTKIKSTFIKITWTSGDQIIIPFNKDFVSQISIFSGNKYKIILKSYENYPFSDGKHIIKSYVKLP